MRVLFCALLMAAGLSSGCLTDQCLADGDKCEGRATVTLEECGEAPEGTLSLSELLADATPRLDQNIAVEGPLRQELGTCTQLGCATPDGCCNGCGAGYALSDTADISISGAGTVSLDGSVKGVLMSCGGDESLLCCPTPGDGRQVRVQGQFIQSGSSTEGPLFRMTIQSMCLVP